MTASSAPLPLPFEADAVQDAVRHLAPRLRAALVLRFGDGLSERDVGTVLGCRTVTAHALVARGLRQVRLALAAAEASPSSDAFVRTRDAYVRRDLPR